MTLLLDNCMPHKYQHMLREWGYDTEFTVPHIAPNARDPNVIQLAQELDAVLVTVDMDFANILAYPPGDYQGIIVIRHQAVHEVDAINTLQRALQDLYRDGLRGTLVVITVERYRIRRE